MPDFSEKNPPSIQIRAPSFQRRFIASETDDPNTLVALASDESYFVRRQAVQNPNTPKWILDLLVRAGATPDLRGKGEIDPDLDGRSLRRLVETGPWARQLVAEHPNTPAEVLAALKDQPSIPLRLAIAAHPQAGEDTLAVLCCDSEGDIRARAATNPHCPPAVLDQLMAAGAEPDLQGAGRLYGDLSEEQLVELAELGAWGRFLAARHPGSPETLLAAIAHDPDWRVRSGLLDNPNTPNALLTALFEPAAGEDMEAVKRLSQHQIPDEALAKLAASSSLEVRFSLARHPAATSKILGILITDGEKEIRRSAAGHPRTRPADLLSLIRAGSTADLMGLYEPDPAMPAAEIQALLEGGIWARLLAVRHPNTDADTLARLLCDREPKIREWAAVHPKLSPETKQNLLRAGSGTDFQGFMQADADLPSKILFQISQLGPWGEWVVAANPNTPADLLETLAHSEDPQVRQFVTRNPSTPAAVLTRLSPSIASGLQDSTQ